MADEQRVKRIHEIVYSCDSREELAERITDLEELCTKMYRLLEYAYWQPAGFLTHGGIRPADMVPIYDEMRMLGIGVDA